MRPRLPTRTDSRQDKASSLPAELADVALIDAPTCAATGAMSVSWWHEQVSAGNAPAPVIRGTRCTRWRLADVRRYWRERAEQADAEAAARVTARARKASAKAQATRKAKAAATPAGQ